MVSVFNENCLSLKDIENGLKRCNSIKYAAYRTAAKLRVLQKAVWMGKVPLKLVSNVFERHQLQQTENSVHLDEQEVTSVLSDIYFVVKKEKEIPLNVDYFSKLLFCLLLNIFDKKASNVLQVFSLRVGLVLLCEAKPREKYHYLFEQLADHNHCLSRKKLGVLLEKMMCLTEYLGERLSFGPELIPGTVESCFKCNIGSLGVSEDVFMSWLMQDPQLLVWLSTFYRLEISESVSHNAKCGLCKMSPMVGLRYRCLRCLSFDMCQSCFFTGKQSKKHKLKHPVQEYCCPMTSQQSTKAFLLTLKNMVCRRDWKLQYLPALRVDARDAESLGQSTRVLDEMEVSCKTVVNGSRVSLRRFSCRELQNIILHLETESEKIIPQIESFCRAMEGSGLGEYRAQLKKCLLTQKAQIEAQVRRLTSLRHWLSSRERSEAKGFVASTPMVEEVSERWERRSLRAGLEGLSPIAGRGFGRREEARAGRETWEKHESGGWRPCREGGASEVRQTAWEGDESEGELSCWLGGRDLRELEGSSLRGFSWLREDGGGSAGEEERIRQENEETFEELQSDLKRILGKLQELSMVTCEAEEGGGERGGAQRSVGIDEAAEMDVLLTELITGMEKLVGH